MSYQRLENLLLVKYLISLAAVLKAKNDEKCFLFHVKSSFRSQDI